MKSSFINKIKTKKKLFCFFLDLFSTQKTKYWSTKLKIEALIWTFIKLFQYFDNELFKVITNHLMLKNAFQTKIIERKSIKLNEWILYLFTFLFKMTIVHRIKKIHQNVNDLSRLPAKTKTETNNFSNVVIANNENLFEKNRGWVFKR